MNPNHEIISLAQLSTSMQQALTCNEKHTLKNLQWRIETEAVRFLKVLPNGGWKQFVAILKGDLSPVTGNIRIKGKEINSLPLAQRRKLLHESIGFIHAGEELVSFLTVWENIFLPAWELQKTMDSYRTHVQALLHWYGLDGVADKFPGQLSPMETTQVLQIRAFAHQPKLVVVTWTEDMKFQTYHGLQRLANATQTSVLMLLLPSSITIPDPFIPLDYLSNGVVSTQVESEYAHPG